MRTINSAYVMRQEDRTGSLKVGKDADLLIIDTDIFDKEIQGDWQAIRSTKVLDTVLEGQEVWRRNGYEF
jgi:predicted amidohydrolase YtcJ